MKLKDVISRVDGMKPNAFSNEVKTGWVNELENMVQTEIFLLAPEEMVEYTWEANAESELLIKAPYSKLYWIYLSAMIDFTHGEYDKYSQTMQMFNAWLQEYQIWYARTFRPADGGAVRMGYYLSAYGLAKLHGFEGTEEDWLKSLVGPQGAPFTYDMFTAAQLAALKGAQGVGIEKIEQTGGGSTTVTDEYGSLATVGRWTDYRITFTDGGVFDYRVEGGADGPRGLRGAAFTYSDFTEEQLAALKGRPFTYEDFTAAQLEALRGPAGESITDISRTSGTGAPGTVDTYTVTTSTSRTWPLYLYNGKDGQGAGDMTAAVYDPTGKKIDVFAYVDQKVANIPTPDVSGQIGSHNTDNAAHNDIRGLITGLTNRLNALADSDDTTLDQMSELVAYIKSNKSLIDAITTAKVSVSDIVNDLVTNDASKTLSAAQGVALKALADAAQTAASAAQTTADGKANASHNHFASHILGGTFTSMVAANNNTAYTTAQVRNIILSTDDATGGSNGQVWIKYK